MPSIPHPVVTTRARKRLEYRTANANHPQVDFEDLNFEGFDGQTSTPNRSALLRDRLNRTLLEPSSDDSDESDPEGEPSNLRVTNNNLSEDEVQMPVLLDTQATASTPSRLRELDSRSWRQCWVPSVGHESAGEVVELDSAGELSWDDAGLEFSVGSPKLGCCPIG